MYDTLIIQFSMLTSVQNRYPQLDELPAVYAALKADLDKTTQRAEIQPDVYTREIGMSAPLHVSAAWASISELFVTVFLPCTQTLSSIYPDCGRRSRKLPCPQTRHLLGQSLSLLTEQIFILQQGLQVS